LSRFLSGYQKGKELFYLLIKIL
jgi:dynein assembly factor 5